MVGGYGMFSGIPLEFLPFIERKVPITAVYRFLGVGLTVLGMEFVKGGD
jgi:hypothetical protein